MESLQVKHLNDAGMDLLQQTLIYNPAQRITAKRILEHEYFDGFVPDIPEMDRDGEKSRV